MLGRQCFSPEARPVPGEHQLARPTRDRAGRARRAWARERV